MNDIEKKMESMKAEFLEKLESLRKEAEEQEKLKPWMPEHGEKYFTIVSIHTPHKGATSGDLFGQQPDGSRKPHRKGVLLPVLTQLQQSIQRFQIDSWSDCIYLLVQRFRFKQVRLSPA